MQLSRGMAMIALATIEPDQLERLATLPAATVVAESAAMREVIRLVDAVAPRATTVLLQGETGSGKGVLARLLHERSPRADRPFVELNCAGLPRELTESELFGHEKGAFTGAAARKLGLFEAADGGTLFLDELAETDLAVQAKLLKVLEQRRFRRLGGVDEVGIDVRVIAATHRDLAQEAVAGRFRSDLMYRLNVFAIRVPPLRERRDEIAVLARQFLRELHAPATELTSEALNALERHAWPGNVRELRNVIERAAILCPASTPISLEHLPPLDAPPDDDEPDADGSLGTVERRCLERSLRAHGWNVLRTARALGITRGVLYRKIEKYGLLPHA
jgi:DNA-binding NtrC family response regulator